MRNFWQFQNKEGTDSAELYLYGEIVSETPWFSEDYVSYRDFVKELNELGDKKNIDVFINSGGGDVFAAAAIYNHLKQNKAFVTINIEGICASAATIVAMAGDLINTAENALIMIHNPKIGLSGYYEQKDLEKYADTVKVVKNSIIEAYKSKLNKSYEELSEIMDNETWYTGKEAVEQGIANGFCQKAERVQGNNYVLINNIPIFADKFEEFPFLNRETKKTAVLKAPIEKALFNIQTGEINAQKEGLNMEFKNADELKEAFPELVSEIINIALTKERERMKNIDSISSAIPKEMVEKAKYENFISAEKLALVSMMKNTEKGNEFLSNFVYDNEKSGVGSICGNPLIDGDKTEKVSRLGKLIGINRKGC